MDFLDFKEHLRI